MNDQVHWLTAYVAVGAGLTANTSVVDFAPLVPRGRLYRLVWVRAGVAPVNAGCEVESVTAGNVRLSGAHNVVFCAGQSDARVNIPLCAWSPKTLLASVTNHGAAEAEIRVSFGLVDDGPDVVASDPDADLDEGMA